jgi:multidrug efflux pump subunit AcrA (membrane-fusion protein)
MLRNLSAFPGQDVAAGAPLFEVIDLSHLWVRASIYAGDMASLDTDSKVAVTELAAGPKAAGHSASPVTAPPTANALAATIDLYYELEPPVETFRPGQRLNVNVPLRSEAQSLVAPWSAIIYDIYGGAWVYVHKGERSFARERVVVRHVVDKTAVLATGPPAGTNVVVAGAAELFGTETGFSK